MQSIVAAFAAARLVLTLPVRVRLVRLLAGLIDLE